jgi:general stress protein 26
MRNVPNFPTNFFRCLQEIPDGNRRARDTGLARVGAYFANGEWVSVPFLEEIAMSNEAELEREFWKALKKDRVAMLGLVGIDEGQSQPMSAQLLEEHEERGGPIWFFTAKDTDLVAALGSGQRAQIHFASKGHDLFAAVHGDLVPTNDRAMIDRLWNRFVAAWFEGGKEDPNLQLLRFDPDRAQVWLNENSALAGVRILLGRDPKKDYQDKVANVRLDSH